MKKKKTDKKESSRKYIKAIAYLVFFYFGIRLILIPVVFIGVVGLDAFGIFNLVLNLGIVVFGLFAAYKLLKMKRWALIAVAIIFGIQIINMLAWGAYFGSVKAPIVQIAILIFIISGFRYLKNAE